MTTPTSSAVPGDAGEALKLERMLLQWEKPDRVGVMLPGTLMTCDEAAAAIRAALTAGEPALPGGDDVALLGAGSEHDLQNTLKSVLYHFGPEGAAKVTKDVLGARPGVLK